TVVVPLLAAVSIAIVLKDLGVEKTSGKLRLFITLVCLGATAQLLIANRAQFDGVFPIAPLDQRFRLLGGPATLVTDRTSNPYRPDSPMLRTVLDGRAFYNCYETLQLHHTAVVEEPLIVTDGRSKIFSTIFSPNRVTARVVAGDEPSRVVLNEN